MIKLMLHLHGAEVESLELIPGRVYTFGRGAQCDVKLDDPSALNSGQNGGISRTHFRVTDESGAWQVEVLSKFGTVNHQGRAVNNLILENGTVFKVANYDFRFEVQTGIAATSVSSVNESANAANTDEYSNLPVAAGQGYGVSGTHATSNTLPVPHEAANHLFSGNDDATRVLQIKDDAEIPFLRIVEPGGREELIKLDGRRWIAGREDGSSILLNDRKASRRQFELTSSPQGYFVRDFGSSNGTLLNGMALFADELKQLRSGDVLQVGAVILHFEIRDPNFEKRLQVVPSSVRSEAPIVLHNTFEMINYPVANGGGGAVRIDGQIPGKNKLIAYALGDDLSDVASKKKRRVLVAIAAIAFLFAIGSVFESAPPPKKVVSEQTGFAKLSPRDQKSVRETFVLAKNLYMQRKLALASDQLTKLHRLLPEGFENSLAMSEDCREAAQQEENLRFIEEQKRKQAEISRVVTDTLAKCERLATTTLDPEALKSCIMPALERAPGDPRVVELQQKVDRRIAEFAQSREKARVRQAAAAKARAIFQRAEDYENTGQDLEAIETYKMFLETEHAGESLKNSARKNMLALTQRLSTKIDEALRTAESAFGQANYREAITQIRKAKALDPNSDKAAEMNARFRRELRIKLKDLYEEAIITEGIGDVEQAKSKWRKILEMDLPDGEYFIKAKSKLRSYGAL